MNVQGKKIICGLVNKEIVACGGRPMMVSISDAFCSSTPLQATCNNCKVNHEPPATA